MFMFGVCLIFYEEIFFAALAQQWISFLNFCRGS